MTDEQRPTSLERVFESLEEDSDALKPFFIDDIRADLEHRGVDTASTTEAVRNLLRQAKAAQLFHSQPDSPSMVEQTFGVGDAKAEVVQRSALTFSEPSSESVEGLADNLVPTPHTGMKAADQFVQRVAAALVTGITDFLVATPFGNRQPLAIRGGNRGGFVWTLRIPALGVRVAFRHKDARGERAFARVISLSDAKVSGVLDGGIVVAGGTVVGHFDRGHAEFMASSLAGQIGLRDSQGIPLEVELESLS